MIKVGVWASKELCGNVRKFKSFSHQRVFSLSLFLKRETLTVFSSHSSSGCRWSLCSI